MSKNSIKPGGKEEILTVLKKIAERISKRGQGGKSAGK